MKSEILKSEIIENHATLYYMFLNVTFDVVFKRNIVLQEVIGQF